jgi:hypothetical protein
MLCADGLCVLNVLESMKQSLPIGCKGAWFDSAMLQCVVDDELYSIYKTFSNECCYLSMCEESLQ